MYVTLIQNAGIDTEFAGEVDGFTINGITPADCREAAEGLADMYPARINSEEDRVRCRVIARAERILRALAGEEDL